MMSRVVGKEAGTFKTATTVWRALDGAFRDWQLEGVSLLDDGSLALDAAQGADGRSLVGQATGPESPAPFPFTQAIPSWNAVTPPGAWVEIQVRARVGERWTRWYSLGRWAAECAAEERRSLDDQEDEDGTLSTDTLILKAPARAFQLKVGLLGVGDALPLVRLAAVTLSTDLPAVAQHPPGDPRLWNRVLDVPQCSQMVYPDGGNVWCSPTSVSMVLGYWAGVAGKAVEPCEPRVRRAVEGVYDSQYEGHGNWPFNTAYAATQGLEAYVARFSSLAEAEPWIAAGVPLVISYSWREGELSNSPVPSSNGHLGVLCGFDTEGNPIVNDPAAARDEDVRRTYLRDDLESIWLEHAGGTVYVSYPPGRHSIEGGTPRP